MAFMSGAGVRFGCASGGQRAAHCNSMQMSAAKGTGDARSSSTTSTSRASASPIAAGAAAAAAAGLSYTDGVAETDSHKVTPLSRRKKSGLKPDALVTVGFPKGSLQEPTLDLFERAGWNIKVPSRSYFPLVDDEDINGMLFRAQELGRYTASGIVDMAITGFDWINEYGVQDSIVEVGVLNYSKVSDGCVRWVLAVPNDSPVQCVEDLDGGVISSELVHTTRRFFADRGVSVSVEFSWGATELKARGNFVDAIVDVTETGDSLRANNLRVVDTLLTSSTRMIANKAAWQDARKREKIEEIFMLLNGALSAKRMVGLKMNAPRAILDKVLAVLPASTSPTISPLYNEEFVALEVVVDDKTERLWIPQLKKLGCSALVTYPINLMVM